jgi:hypothetical protein
MLQSIFIKIQLIVQNVHLKVCSEYTFRLKQHYKLVFKLISQTIYKWALSGLKKASEIF